MQRKPSVSQLFRLSSAIFVLSAMIGCGDPASDVSDDLTMNASALGSVHIPGYQVVIKDVYVPGTPVSQPSIAVTETIACPAGKLVLSGGAIPTDPGAFQAIYLAESGPDPSNPSSPAGWRVGLVNRDSPQRHMLLVAVCADRLPGYEVVHRTLSVPAAQTVRDAARCSAGKVALGGGVTVSGGSGRQVLGQSAPGSAGGDALWLVSILNGASVSKTVVIDAVCASPTGLAGYEIVSRESTVARTAGVTSTSVKCPSSKTVIGGGASEVRSGSRSTMTLFASGPSSTVGGDGIGWQADVLSFATADQGGSSTVGISAICVDRN
jgi:hypothetical protein